MPPRRVRDTYERLASTSTRYSFDACKTPTRDQFRRLRHTFRDARLRNAAEGYSKRSASLLAYLPARHLRNAAEGPSREQFACLPARRDAAETRASFDAYKTLSKHLRDTFEENSLLICLLALPGRRARRCRKAAETLPKSLRDTFAPS